MIIARGRARRPITTVDASLKNGEEKGSYCPFCEGEEAATPKETFALRADGLPPDRPGWRLRVVPNKFPALQIKGDVSVTNTGLYRIASGVGAHEVIIETPDHSVTMAQMGLTAIADIFRTVASRFKTYRNDKRITCVQFFKNHGAAAGASLPHAHSQIMGMPVVSKMIAEEVIGATRWQSESGRCPYCDIIEHDRKTGDRMIYDDNHFVALAPYAPRFPYETIILPANHEKDFDAISDDEVVSLSTIIKKLLVAFDTSFNFPAYNLMLHTAPFDIKASSCYHWHIKLMPTLGRTAGFEWSTGFHINPVPPEEAADFLRELL